MKLAAVAASQHRTVLYRIASGDLHERFVDAADPAHWTIWAPTPFVGEAISVAAISGWSEQIEVFVLDDTGAAHNRWWWVNRGWRPTDAFNPLGRPFPGADARQLAATSAGAGYFNVFVEADDGRMAMLPHLPAPGGPTWRRCNDQRALGDGWWPVDAEVADLYRPGGQR